MVEKAKAIVKVKIDIELLPSIFNLLSCQTILLIVWIVSQNNFGKQL